MTRKIEKPTIKHKPLTETKEVVVPEASAQESPYGALDKAFPECKGKLIYAWESQVEDEDNFRPPTGFFINDALGGHIYFKTNSRINAQRLCNLCFGENKYIVKIVVRAAIR